MTTMLLNMEEVRELIAHDLVTTTGEHLPISQAADSLRRWRHQTSDNPVRGREYDFDSYVTELAKVLDEAFVWPFEPIVVDPDRHTLIDGHHRVLAALSVGWKCPIPAESPWWARL